MRFIRTKTGIGIVALIAVFAFLYLFTGVFGNTKINLTLRTNPDLENGLVAHYTFDGQYEQGTFEFGAGGATTTDPTSGLDRANAITTDPSGYVYVTGICFGCGPAGSYAHYTFKIDPSNGDMIDTTTAGAVQSVGATKTSGNIGQGVEFDGVDDYIETGDNGSDVKTIAF